MHTLHAQSAGSGKTGLDTVQYVPGTALPPSSDEADSEEEELAQRRIVSRQASSRLTAVSSPERESRTPADRRSPSGTPGGLLCPHPGCPRAVNPFTKMSGLKRHIEGVHKAQTDVAETTEGESPVRPRSRSGTPGAPLFCPHQGCRRATEPFTKLSNFKRHIKDVHNGETEPTDLTEVETPPRRRSRSATPAGKAAHFCHYADCPRALEGFAKRTNLARHLQLVHGKRAAEETDEEDSADEMDGGVHVDRFLKPIKLRKGWRGEDAMQRLGRSRKKARAGSEELDSAFF